MKSYTINLSIPKEDGKSGESIDYGVCPNAIEWA